MVIAVQAYRDLRYETQGMGQVTKQGDLFVSVDMARAGDLILVSVLSLTLAQVHIIEYTCFSYKIMDVSQNVIEIRCNSSMVFSPVHGECIRPVDNLWPCDTKVDCSKTPDHKYADTKEGCNTYYTCQGGVFFGHNYCPGVTIFNEKGQYCDWVYNVEPPCGTLGKPNMFG